MVTPEEAMFRAALEKWATDNCLHIKTEAKFRHKLREEASRLRDSMLHGTHENAGFVSVSIISYTRVLQQVGNEYSKRYPRRNYTQQHRGLVD